MNRGRRTVLVTGARGFVGAACLPLLAARGFEVVAVTSAEVPADSPGLKWQRCDLLDPATCAALIGTERPTHLLHLAWITTPGTFWSSPANLGWLAAGARLASEFYRSGGGRAVGLGSCAEYAIPDDAPCIEDVTPLGPATVYGKAKAAMHLAIQAAAQAHGKSYAWGRLFFPYGPGEAVGRFIPSVIRGLLARDPVACTHGLQVRDFIFVSDAAAACVALLESDRSAAYNIGSGTGVSLRQVAEALGRTLGGADLVRYGARQPPAFDPPRIIADVGRIGRDTGWAPRVGLEDGLARSVDAQRAGAAATHTQIANPAPGAAR